MPANPRTTQFTIRNVPLPVSRYLRRRAQATGESINTVIIQELSKSAHVASTGLRPSAFDKVKDLFGSGFDPEAAKILDEDEKLQKELTRKSWAEEPWND